MTTDQTPNREHRPTQRSATEPPPSPLRVGEDTQSTLDNDAALDDEAGAIRSREAAIDAALDMTFPASDPPAWTP